MPSDEMPRGAHAETERRSTGSPQRVTAKVALALQNGATLPLPRRLELAAGEGAFVGRAAELEALATALADARPGAPTVVTLAGDPGMGKTRLAAEAALRARATGCPVLYGRSEQALELPYQPFAEMLEQLAADVPDDMLATVEAELVELAGLAPMLGERVPARLRRRARAPESSGPHRLYAAICALLAATSARSPLLLVLDDLHWADRATLALLGHVLTSAQAPQAALLLAFRADELPDGELLASVLSESDRRGRLRRLSLGGLSQSELRSLAADRAGELNGVPEGGSVSEAVEGCAGNPFFAIELLRAAASPGGHTGLAPVSVREIIRARTARLGPAAQELLSAAAVAGRETDLAVLERVVDQPSDVVAEVLDRAQAAGLVEWVGRGGAPRLGFAHALIAKSLYEELGPLRRARLHRRVGEGLEELWEGREGAPVGELAHHWQEASPPDLVRATHYTERAAERALVRREPEAALRLFERALELAQAAGIDAERSRARMLIGLGVAQAAAGRPAFRETLLEAGRLARRLGEHGLLVRSALANSRGFVSASGTVDEERLALLGAALESVEQRSVEQARLLATLASELSFSDGDRERRVDLSDRALELARSLGDPETLSHVLTARFVVTWAPETLGQRLGETQENVAAADVADNPVAQFWAVHWRAVALVQAGRLTDAARAAARQDELARRLGDPTTRWLSTYDRANLAIISGGLEQAEGFAERALAIATDSAQPDALPFYASQLTNIRFEQGRLGELQPLIAEIVSENPGIPAFRAVLALAYCEADLQREAANVLAIDAASAFAELPRDVTWLAGHAIYAHVAAEVANAEVAAVLMDALEPWADQVVYTGISAWGSVDHALGRLAGVLGDHERAASHLDSALSLYDRIGAPIWAARAALHAADVALAGGRGKEALPLLERAATEGARLGSRTVERRASALVARERAASALARGSSFVRLGLRGGAAVKATRGAAAAPAGRHGVLRREGESWAFELAGRSLHVSDGRGPRHLARLLEAPGVELHVLDLQAEVNVGPAVSDGSELVPRVGGEDAGAVLDAQAKCAYKARIDELRAEREQAARFNDPERAARAGEELAAVAGELAAATGLGGRDRRAASSSERARVNVTRSIRRTIAKIEQYDAELGAHLAASVSTGAFCCYQPVPQAAIEWRVHRG